MELTVTEVLFGATNHTSVCYFQGIPGELGAVGQTGPRVGECPHDELHPFQLV